MTDLLRLDPVWVTLRAQTEDGLPVVVLVDQAVTRSAPHPAHPLQIAMGVPFSAGPDGQPVPEEAPRLRELEQRLVDAAAGQARLVAVLTLEGVREWTFYGATSGWAQPLRDEGISLVETVDPAYHGLLELSGLA